MEEKATAGKCSLVELITEHMIEFHCSQPRSQGLEDEKYGRDRGLMGNGEGIAGVSEGRPWLRCPEQPWQCPGPGWAGAGAAWDRDRGQRCPCHGPFHPQHCSLL